MGSVRRPSPSRELNARYTPPGTSMPHEAAPSIIRSNPPELGTPPGYSQIVDVSAGRLIFISGQTALDRDGNVVGKRF